MQPIRFPSRMMPPRSSRLIFLASSLAAITSLGGGCSQQDSLADQVVFKTEDWQFKRVKGQKLTSAHYALYTTCTSKPFVGSLPGFLESCWEAYADLVPPEKEPDEPMPTYLFAKRWEWERFTEEFTGPRAPTYKRIRSGGYSENGTTVSHYGSQRSTLSILAHEGFHQFLELTRGQNIPPWVNEGLACYFESFDLDRQNRPIFKPEKNFLRIPALREALISKSLIPLKEILAMHAGQAVQQNLNHVQNYYAQEWSMIVFMMQDTMANPYRRGFRLLLDELGTAEMDRKARAFLATDTDDSLSPGEAVFRAYITEDLETFQRDYENFLQSFLNLAG